MCHAPKLSFSGLGYVYIKIRFSFAVFQYKHASRGEKNVAGPFG